MQREQAAPRSGRPPTSQSPETPIRGMDRRHAARDRRAALARRLVVAVSSALGGRRSEGALGAVGGRDGSAGRGRAVARAEDTLVVSLPLDGRGPRAARTAVEGLRGRIAPSVLEDAKLIASELVTNAVRHGGVSRRGVVGFCVELTGTMVRLEVTDPGDGGVIAPRAPDHETGGGFGLHVVRALSERWGLEQVAAGETRVWAQLPRVGTAAPADARGAPR